MFTTSNAVSASISIRRDGKKLFADVLFENKLDRSICVYERNLGWFERTPVYITIRNTSGTIPRKQNVAIEGDANEVQSRSLVKITSMLHSCIKFEKGFSYTNSYSLLDFFQFPKTKDTYRAFYRGPGFPFYDPPEDETTVWLRSDPVTFELDNRPFWEKWFD